MLYSQLFTKTKKEAPKDEVSLNAQLLIKAGFIHKEMAGVYAFLPLGKRVLDKIIDIIREEMNAIGGQEVLLGSLQNPAVWEATNRWADGSIDVWFKTNLQAGSEVGLAPTHEEPLTALMTQHIASYKDLPVYVYQFQLKFRNETRAKSGLLRTREFIMKDLYSFSKTQEDLDTFYEQAKQAYHTIFNRLGFGDYTFLTFASGGAFSKYSHEFQTLCPNGEDTIYLDRAKGIAVNKEVYTDEVLADLGVDKTSLEEVRAIEVGNIFRLGTKFSSPLGLSYTDVDGSVQPVIMGSYGIAPSRSMGTAVELFHDDKGIMWPEAIAPFKVHLVGLGMDNDVVRTKAFAVYDQLLSADIEVLFDDRDDVSNGEKLSDADLIGIPHRIIVSAKTEDKLEWKRRNSSESVFTTFDNLITNL